jgi:GxxExxY protein
MDMDIEQLVKEILDCAKEVRKELKQGFEEKVYKNAMFLEIKSRALDVKTEVPYDVQYKGTIVGSYRADMVVEDRLECKRKFRTYRPKNMSICPYV